MNENDFNIFFAPVSSGSLYLNFEKTVLEGINLEYFDLDTRKYFLETNKNVKLWGIRDAKKRAYNKTQVNDYVLFYKEGFIIGYSKVQNLFIDSELSMNLWGIFENKQRGEFYTWSNIIVFSDFNSCKIPFSVFIKLAEYSEKFSVRGYLEYRDSATRKIIEEYGDIEKFIKSFNTLL